MNIKRKLQEDRRTWTSKGGESSKRSGTRKKEHFRGQKRKDFDRKKKIYIYKTLKNKKIKKKKTDEEREKKIMSL